MDVGERSERRVDEVLARLRSEHGPVEPIEREWTVSHAEYERTRERFEAGTVGGAGAWVTNDDGEVLLVRETGVETWSEPSGKHESGETLAETARREVREETGIDCELSGLELVQDVTMWSESGDGPLRRLIVVFAAEYRNGDLRPAEGEIDAVRWWDEHPENLLYAELRGLVIPANG